LADAAAHTCKRILKGPGHWRWMAFGCAILVIQDQHQEGDMLTALLIVAILAVVITGLVIVSAMQDVRDDY